jgi:hypothetical protein
VVDRAVPAIFPECQQTTGPVVRLRPWVVWGPFATVCKGRLNSQPMGWDGGDCPRAEWSSWIVWFDTFSHLTMGGYARVASGVF